MSEVCSTLWVELYAVSWWENLTERVHLEGLGVNERIILKFTF